MVSHLQPYCSTVPHAAHARSRSSRARNLARAQARAWERTKKMPVIPDSSEVEDVTISTSTSSTLKHADTYDTQANESEFAEAPPGVEALSLDSLPKIPAEDTSLTPGET